MKVRKNLATCEIDSGGGTAVCGGYGIGGVSRLLLMNFSQIDQASITFETTPGANFNSLKTFEMLSTFQAYEVSVRLRSGGGNFELSGGNSPANSKFWKKTLVFTIDSQSQEKANFLDDLGLSTVVAVLVTNEKNTAGTQSRILIFGLDSGLILETATGGTGVALEDLSGSALTLTGADLYSSKEAIITGGNPAWLTALLTPAP